MHLKLRRSISGNRRKETAFWDALWEEAHQICVAELFQDSEDLALVLNSCLVDNVALNLVSHIVD